MVKYTKQTGQDLRNHPLASKIDRCDSAESILAIFQEQAKAFQEFRDRDPKLLKYLRPTVDGLYALSTAPALSATIGLVSPTNCLYSFDRLSNPVDLGVSPCIINLLWDQCPSICVYPPTLYPPALLISRMTDAQVGEGKLRRPR